MGTIRLYSLLSPHRIHNTSAEITKGTTRPFEDRIGSARHGVLGPLVVLAMPASICLVSIAMPCLCLCNVNTMCERSNKVAFSMRPSVGFSDSPPVTKPSQRTSPMGTTLSLRDGSDIRTEILNFLCSSISDALVVMSFSFFA